MNFNKRINKIYDFLSKKGHSCFLITSPQNLFYLTGFQANEFGFLLIRGNDVKFLTNFIYEDQAKVFFNKIDNAEIIDTKGKTFDILKKLLNGCSTLFFEPSMEYSVYKKVLSSVSPIELEPEGRLFNDLRVIKDKDEIEAIERAVTVAEESFKELVPKIKTGMKEYEIKALLEYNAASLGAENMSFSTIVASGNNSAYPHAHTGRRSIRNSDFLMIDYGIVLNGYCSDTTRTHIIGEYTKKHSEIYNIVLEAQLKAIENIKPGITGKEADSIARDVIAKAGYGDKFGHSLGHGVGIDVHERPRLSALSDEVLSPGMVVTVEPGIYIPGFGGVRIEDIVVITDSSCRPLNKLYKKLTILGG